MKKQQIYEQCVVNFSENDRTIMEAGVFLANALRKARRTIEAEILLTKLAAVSFIVHIIVPQNRWNPVSKLQRAVRGDQIST